VEVLADPTVLVRFMNLKVTVLGMVGQEGPISVPGEKLNIFEAVGLAGGINDFGKKNTVKVIRETDGQREVGLLDLTSQKVFESPYYNLVQNDLVIVEATSQKQTEQQQTKIMQKITFAFTIVTAVAALSNIFIRN